MKVNTRLSFVRRSGPKDVDALNVTFMFTTLQAYTNIFLITFRPKPVEQTPGDEDLK